MKKTTAFILSILLLFSSFVLWEYSFPIRSAEPVETTVVVGEFYSKISLIPSMVESGQQAFVSITVLDADGSPKPDRIIEIYEKGGSPSLLVIQPTQPSDENGITGGYVGGMNLGTYDVCIKDVTEGVGTIIALCKPLRIIPVPPPSMGPEPEYTKGDSNTVSWTTNGTGVYEYELEVSTTEDFSDVLESSGWISDTSYTVTDLVDGQKYFYRVRARNSGGGVSDWSEAISSIQDDSGPEIIFVGSSQLPLGTTVEEFDPNTVFTLTYKLLDPNGIDSRALSVILLDGTRADIPYTATFDGINWIAKIRLGDLPKDNGIHLDPAYSFYLEVKDNFGNVSGNGQGNISIPPKKVIPPVEPPVEPPVVPPVVPPVEPPVVPPVEPPVKESPYTIPGTPVQVSESEQHNPKLTWVPSYDNNTGEVAPGYEVQWCDNRNFLNCSDNIFKTKINDGTIEKELAPGNWYVRVRAFDMRTSKASEWSNTASILITEPVPPVQPPIEPPVEEPQEEKSSLKKVAENIGKAVTEIARTITSALDENIQKIEPEIRIATTVGVLVANTVAGMNIVLNMLGSIPYVLTQFSIVFLSLLGFRKKGVYTGYVYDSITKDSIGQAIVRVFTKSHVLVWTDVSDNRGRYKTPDLDNGEYYIKVTAKNYTYPSNIVTGGKDYPFENVYNGSEFSVEKGVVPNFAIPLDSIKATNAQRIRERVVSSTKWLWQTILFILFGIGLTFSIYALKTNPVWWNYLVLFLYIPSLLLLVGLLGKKEKYGIVRDEEGKTIEGITIYLTESEFDKIISTRVSDEGGRYRFIVEQGSYTIALSSTEYELVNAEKFKDLKVVKKGSELLCPNLVVKRKK